MATTKRMVLINKNEFTAAVFDADKKNFVVHVAALDTEIPNVYLSWAV